ncbi:helix-turn-helix transcriptional regulator [Streptomyces albireticuli]|nr:BREX system ATP-binding domain-containing protein [Streptomyces albireticuli]
MSLQMILVNREKELDLLASALTECAAGRSKTVVVEGGVGCGKSELLETFAEYATVRGAVVLRAVGMRSTDAQPFAVLRQLADQTGQGGPDPTRPPTEHDFLAALHRMAATSPVVVCVDDAQDGDIRSLHHLLQLAGRLRSARLLLVFTDSLHLPHQDPLIKTELLRRSNSLRIRLGPLTEQGTAELLAAHDGDPRDPALVARLHSIGAGNPLLLRALLEECLVTGAGTPSACGEPLVGGLYGQAVLACLYRSGSVALEVGHALAVLGDAGTPGLVARMLDQPAAPLDQNLHALRAAGVLDGTRFRHRSAAATVEADMAPARRTALHRKAAAVLYAAGAASPAIARHLLAAQRAVEPWELIALRNAAEDALGQDDAKFAVDCLELAHDSGSDESQRIEIKMRLALVMWRTNPAAAEYQHLPGLLAAMRAGMLSSDGLVMLGKLLVAHGRIEEALEVIARCGIDAPDTAPESGIHPYISSLWARYGFPAVMFPEEVRATVPPAPDPADERVPGVHLLQRSAESLLLGGGGDDWAASAESFLKVATLTDAMLGPVGSALKALLYADRVEEAAAWCARALDESTRRDIPGWQAVFATTQGLIALRQGRLEDAITSVERALAVVPERNGSVLVCGTTAILAVAYTELGRYDDAARQISQPVPEAWFKSVHWLGYLRARGFFHLATDRPLAALADFLKIGKLAGRWGIDHPMLVSWRTEAAECWLRVGEPVQAAEVLSPQPSEKFPGSGRIRGITLRLEAALAPLSRRPELLRRSVEDLHSSCDRLEAAKALADLRDAYQELGDPMRAELARRRAWHIARECGAEPLCRRVAPGRREAPVPREDTTPAPAPAEPAAEPGGELTRAEHRVASLAAYGRTNREISEQLYITVSTVEQHLTRVYRKLRITRRHQLPMDL